MLPQQRTPLDKPLVAPLLELSPEWAEPPQWAWRDDPLAYWEEL